ncbi:MAG: hypothetical protein JSS66_06495 [Armatimonadetes bacterium]|nr:hypothetical protein [Armatimonadota bacterium]
MIGEYSKIHTLFQRDEQNKVIFGKWSLPEIEHLACCKWLLSEKLDGQNIRVEYKDGQVDITGRTKDAVFSVDMDAALKAIFDTPTMLSALEKTFKGGEAVLYGEGIGPGICGGGKYAQQHTFVLFDVYVPTLRNPSAGTYVDGWWLHRHNCEDVANKLGLEIVPGLGLHTLYDAIKLVKAGFKSQWGNFFAEGIVAKTPTELYSRKGERILTKIKHKDFLNLSEQSV